jgi:hypothetical protein
MNKRIILSSLSNIANTLDNNGLYPEANTLTNVMKRIAEEDLAPEDPKPAYDYKEERLYKEVLSDFGKEYVADRNRENPITSFKEFDSAVNHAFQSSNPRLGEMMFLSPFEQSQNVFTQINPDVSELLRGMFMIERGIDDDKTFQSFKGNIFPALKKKIKERPSTETIDLTTGNVPFARKTTDKSNEYYKLLRRAKSLVKKAAGEYWNQSGAQSSMDNLLRYIINDDYNKKYRDEAYSIMEEAQRLHDELKSDEANMPKYPIDVPKF